MDSCPPRTLDLFVASAPGYLPDVTGPARARPVAPPDRAEPTGRPDRDRHLGDGTFQLASDEAGPGRRGDGPAGDATTTGG